MLCFHAHASPERILIEAPKLHILPQHMQALGVLIQAPERPNIPFLCLLAAGLLASPLLRH